MKNKLMIAAVAVLAVFALFIVLKSKETAEKHAALTEPSEPVAPSHGHSHDKVPAFETVVDASKLPPTLGLKDFYGKTREAYAVAKAIPETLAQLPCYCY